MGLSQRSVDGSEAALKREAAGGARGSIIG